MATNNAPASCPVCGKFWSQQSVDSSFSAGKAAAGAILVGPIGVVAGINGKKRRTYSCRHCGFTATY